MSTNPPELRPDLAPRARIGDAPRPGQPTIGMVSLGCPKALVDSERILTRLRADGYAEVLFSYAREGRYDFLLSAMASDAAARGAAVLTGTVKPPRLPSYKGQRCFFFANQWTVVHSRRPELTDAFHRGRALLTALDGEKWTRFGDLFTL